MDGTPARFKRRDLRRGSHTGAVARTPDGVELVATWDDPLGGRVSDRFRLVGPRELHVDTLMLVGDVPVTYTLVYTKAR